MAVAHSAASESHAATTGSVSQTSFSWTHTQTGTPQGVLVFVHVANSTGNPVGSVTYGSVTLTRVSGGAAIDGAGEAGRTDLFFAGSGLGTGNQTITVNRANTTDIVYASAATVTALTNTNVTGIILLEGDGTLTQQSVTDGGAPTNSLRYAAAYSGLAAPPVTGANSTSLTSIDFGQYGAAMVRETTAGTGARLVGFTDASDDRAAVHVAVRELWNRTDTETVGAFTLTGQPNTLARGRVMTGDRGAFTLTGQPADLRHNPRIDGGTGAFTFIGRAADTLHNTRVDSGTGAFSLTGNDATLSKTAAPSKSIAADRGQFTLTGNPATLAKGHTITAETGTFIATGQPATLLHNPRIEAATGSFALSGGAPALLRGRYLSGGAGTFIETGQPATFRRTWTVQAATGAFTFTGNPASLTELGAYEIDAVVGVIAFTGQPADTRHNLRIEANTGAFGLNGGNATFSKGVARILPAKPGQFTVGGRTWAAGGWDNATWGDVGENAVLLRGWTLDAGAGALTETGQPAALKHAWAIQGNTGLFSAGGRTWATGGWDNATWGNVLLLHGSNLGGSSGVFIATGQPAALTVNTPAALGRGLFALSGQPAALKLDWRLTCERGQFVFTGISANLTDTDKLEAAVGLFTLTGYGATLDKVSSARRRIVFIF